MLKRLYRWIVPDSALSGLFSTGSIMPTEQFNEMRYHMMWKETQQAFACAFEAYAYRIVDEAFDEVRWFKKYR